MTIKQQIISQLEKVLSGLGIEDVKPVVDYPADAKHGDYSANIALIAAKKLKRNPMELAEEIAHKFKVQSEKLKIIEKIEFAKPGFINFWVKDEMLISSLSKSEEIKSSLTGKKISVEYTDPNPFKELHIGHLYSNIIGESLCLIFEANGATVWRADYFGDVGMHVAKAIWGIRQKIKDLRLKIKDLEEKNLDDRVKFLGEGYALGSNEFEEKDNAAEEVKHLNKLIYIAAQKMWEKEKGIKPFVDYRQGEKIDEKELEEIYAIYTLGRKWSLEYFETFYKRLGTKFDGYYPESIAGERGYKLVRENIKNGIFVESEGAVIFPGESQGLHNRVFINKLGLPTYEGKEIGLPEWKYEDFQYDESYIITANEIASYFRVLVEALKKVHPELGQKTHPLLHGMVRLPEGKMSSRSGNVITVEWLLDSAKQNIKKQHPDIREDVAEDVGVGAVKYAFLRSGIGRDVTFDLDESISFEGNSGPYIQYSYARTQSVLGRVGGSAWEVEKKSRATSYELRAEERQLLRLLARFSEIVVEAADRLAPNLLCTYLFELSQAFNLFYQRCPILKPEGDPTSPRLRGARVGEVREVRLMLTTSTGETLKKGLSFLGIKAPEKM